MGWRETLNRDITPPVLRRMRGWWIYRIPFAPWFLQQWQTDMRHVFAQFDAIVRTNASLPHGLQYCALDAPNARVAGLLQTLADTMDHGVGLSVAMKAHKHFFRPHWIDFVQAAEESGTIRDALRQIIEELDHDLERGRDIRNRLAYFLFLLVLQLLVIGFLVSRIFPVFVEINAEFGSVNPVSLEMMTHIWSSLQGYLALLLIVCVLLPGLLYIFFRIGGPAQTALCRILLLTPVFGPLYRRRCVHKAATILATALSSGVPLPAALRLVAESSLPRPYRKAFQRAEAAVEQGLPLSQALEPHTFLLGHSFPALVKIGEQRQNLGTACSQARDLSRRAIVRTETAIAAAIVPIGVFVCGSGVLLASMGVYSSLTGIADTIIAGM